MCRREEWRAAEGAGAYQGSSQDKADGFIHFSTAAQIQVLGGEASRGTARAGTAGGRPRHPRRLAQMGGVAGRRALPASPWRAAAQRRALGEGAAARRRRTARLSGARSGMSALVEITLPLLRRLPPETAHRLTLRALRLGAAPRRARPDPPSLAITLWGRRFPNPVGLAAGFDKNAEVPHEMLRFGFGFVEIGTVTPRPQAGNPRPRLFRLKEDEALINRSASTARDSPPPRRGSMPASATASSAPISARTATPRTTSPIMSRASLRWRRSPTISWSTSPRRTRRGCASCSARTPSLC